MNATLPFAQAMTTALADALAADPSLVVLTEGESPTSSLASSQAPDRVIALPIADRAALAVATGLAWAGRRVVIEVASTGRLVPLAEALREAARERAGFPATVVLRVPYGEEAGVLDAASLDLLGGLSGVTVVAPRDAGQAAALFRAALALPSPTVLLEPRALQRESGPVDGRIASLDGDVVRDGDDAVIVAFGTGVHEAQVAADALAGAGIEVAVVDLVRLAPLRVAGWAELFRRCGRLVVVSDDTSFGARVVSAVLADAFLCFEAPPVVVPSRAEPIADAVRAALAY